MSEPSAIAIREVSWTAQSPALTSIRRRIFIEEQGVPETEEWDGLDNTARHFLALAPSGEAVGAARLVLEASANDPETTGYHIGRVAVLPSWRRMGVGSALMQTMIWWCQQDSVLQTANIHLNAQIERLSFYRRLGFSAQGEVFMDAGIPHRAMFLEPKA